MDPTKLQAIARERRDDYARARPFPHVILDDFLEPEAAEAVHREFLEASSSSPAWKYYRHYNENKRALTDLGLMSAATRGVFEELFSKPFLSFVETLTGIGPLLADRELDGAGLHETQPGGHLNVHCDFQSHTLNKRWSRQVNLLLFLNKDWRESYKGRLELWDAPPKRCIQKILPTFNRCVIFSTQGRAFHGVPEGVGCPAGQTRKSLALYYFREEQETCRLKPTYYAARPEDPWPRRFLIAADRRLVAFYSWLKRHGAVADRWASRVLKRF